MQYYYILMGIVKIQNTDKHQMLPRLRNNRNSHSFMLGMQNGAATLEDSLAVSCTLNIFLPYDPAITLLSMYTNELKTYVHIKICTWIFLAALFTLPKPGGNQEVLQKVNGEINWYLSRQWNITYC